MGLCCGVDLKPHVVGSTSSPLLGTEMNIMFLSIWFLIRHCLLFWATREVLSRVQGLIRIKSLDEQKLICIWDLETNRNFQKQEWAYLRSYFLKATTALVLNINRLVVRAVQRDQPPLLWYEAVKTNK